MERRGILKIELFPVFSWLAMIWKLINGEQSKKSLIYMYTYMDFGLTQLGESLFFEIVGGWLNQLTKDSKNIFKARVEYFDA